jgi:hypothetical protein
MYCRLEIQIPTFAAWAAKTEFTGTGISGLGVVQFYDEVLADAFSSAAIALPTICLSFVSLGSIRALSPGKVLSSKRSSWGQISSDVVPDRVFTFSPEGVGKDSWWGCWLLFGRFLPEDAAVLAKCASNGDVDA